MVKMYTILNIALYEAKTLMRSWFFRIFSLVLVALLVTANMSLYVIPASSRWMFYGIPSTIPYMNILVLNIFQAVIGALIASDFLKFDYKLDTTDVIYIRSMTNADYVLGKVKGIFAVFVMLNIVALVIAFIFNFFFVDIPLSAGVYLYYPLLISLPTLMFVFGLTFFLMILFRNQALTFILVLAYTAATLLFLRNMADHLFDFVGLSLPFLYSDFVGFGDLGALLMQRGMYVLLGIGFVFTTILLLKRLPQSNLMDKVSMVIAVLGFAGAAALGVMHVSYFNSARSLRAEMVKLNDQYKGTKLPSVTAYDIKLTHSGSTIAAEAVITVENRISSDIGTYVFSLNPGLKVQSVTAEGEAVNFERNKHILSVKPATPLAPGKTDKFTVTYAGTVDDNACYADLPEDTRKEEYRVFLYNIQKKYNFITPDYLLLTSQGMWYPEPGAAGGVGLSAESGKDFSTFNLTVKTGEALTALSQGKAEKVKPGEFVFTPETPLSRISLTAAKFDTKSITVDSTKYSVYYLAGNDFFSQYFTAADKYLEKLIQDTRAEFENSLNRSYPFTRFAVVETPIQFFVYPKVSTRAMETVQPGQVFLPEKAMYVGTADFKTFSHFMSRMMARRGGEVSPENMERNLLRRFVNETLSGSTFGNRMFQFMRQGGSGGSSSFSLESLVPPGFTGQEGATTVFPMFYTFTNYFSSDKYPIFNTMVENYMYDKMEASSNPFRRFAPGLTDQDKANLTLKEQSLEQIIADAKSRANVEEVIKLKSTYLFSLINNRIKDNAFDTFLNEYLNMHKFAETNVSDFLSEIQSRFGLNLGGFIDMWLKEKQLPAYIIKDVTAHEILDKEKARYQIEFEIANLEQTEGLVKLEVMARRSGGRGMRGGFRGGNNIERTIAMKPGEHKKVGFVIDDQPFLIIFNTLISQNIPSSISQGFQRIEQKKDARPFEGEVAIAEPVELHLPGEIIVDNEDAGFTTNASESESLLKSIISNANAENQDDEFSQFRFGRLPEKWKTTISSNYYGAFKKSADIIKAGSGKNKVTWTADIPANGQYDVYFYVSGNRGRRGGPDRQRSSNSNQQQRRMSFFGDFHFTVTHDDGKEEVKIDVADVDNGWTLLGSYYFSKGSASVELSDKSKGRVVYADAVKWVKR